MQAALSNALQQGWFPLIAAVDAGDGGAVRTMLQYGADANQAVVAPSEHPTLMAWDWIGSTALSLAARKGHRPAVEILLGHEGTEVDKANPGSACTPAYVAAQNGHLEVVRVLADNGANLDLAKKDGFTPVCMAAYNGHHEIVRMLADKGANLNLAKENGATPVYMAA